MTVKDAVKESLIGTSDESHQVRTNFLRHARKDETSGEYFMTEDDFVDAIAPKHEDYVSRNPSSLPMSHTWNFLIHPPNTSW